MRMNGDVHLVNVSCHLQSVTFIPTAPMTGTSIILTVVSGVVVVGTFEG